VHGENEHRQGRKFGHDHLRQLDPVGPFQPEIGDNQMRLHFADHIHPLTCAARFAAEPGTTALHIRVD